MVFLGENLNSKETLSHEYKEFCLKHNVYEYYSFDELEQMVLSGKLLENFNTVIHDNIKNYFLCYIPRYASAFSNSTDCEKGILTIGINDYGEVTGIPYIGELDVATLQTYLQSTYKYIRADDNSQKWKKEYFNQIRIEVIPVDIIKPDLYLHDMTEHIYNKMKVQQDLYDREYKLYLIERDKWIKEFTDYACSINDMMSKRRDLVIDYIKQHAPRPDPIVNYLNNYLPIDLDNLEERKYDEDDYLHWIFQFKDITIDRFLNNKPRPPLYPKICNAPLALMTHLSDMRLKFIQNNKDLRYYLIKVHFSAKIQKPGAKTLEFYNPYRGIWQSRNRMWDPYIGPCCA